MKKNSNHINIQKHLTQTELLDYTHGVLGNEEMYRLELHLNECELCCDALEGTSLVKNPKEVLEAINTEILPNKKNVFIPNYMAIAASIALIAIFSLSYWLITKPTKTDTIALNSPTEVKEDKPISSTLGESKLAEEAKNSPSDPVTEDEVVEEDIIDSSMGASVAEKLPEANSIAKREKTIKAKEIEPVEPTVAIADDSEVNFQDNKEADQLEEAIFETTDEKESLAEAVQSTQSVARASKKSASTQSTILKDQKEAAPIGGMAGLKTYINKNLKYPQQAIDNNIKGTVVLEISINSDGSINNISIIKGLGFGCDAEAMRLISTGPRWTPKVENGKAVKSNRQVKIKFKK